MTKTTITIKTRTHTVSHTTLRGPRGFPGPQGIQGPPGDPASVTPDAVQTALADDPAAARSALELGSAAEADAADFDPAGAAAALTAADVGALPITGGNLTGKLGILVPSVPGAYVPILTGVGNAPLLGVIDTTTLGVMSPRADIGANPAYGLVSFDSASANGPVLRVTSGVFSNTQRVLELLKFTGTNTADFLQCTVGSTVRARITSSGSIQSIAPISPGAYTVANLPAPASLPVGAHAYATNGRRAGEGAGAGTGIPVWSDGSKWRTFYDNAEVQS